MTTSRTEDRNRPNWNGNGPRPLAWTAWYPAEVSQTRLRDDDGKPGTSFFIDPGAVRNAPLADASPTWPVVMLSHGTGGTMSGLGWLGVRLASAGYVVIGVDHHGNTASEPYRAEGFLSWWERPRDLSLLLDFHLGEGPFAGRLDQYHIYAAGFSLGGYTVLSLLGAITDMSLFASWMKQVPGMTVNPREFPGLAEELVPLLERNSVFRASWGRQSQSFLDERIRAGLLCAPAPPVRGFTIDSLASIRRPVAITVGGNDQEAPAEICSGWLHDHLPNSSLKRLESTAGHFVFLCECTELGKTEAADICLDASGVDRRAIHDRTASLAISTFSANR
ncbi:MAG: alpha/beta hydrolase [Rhodospirillales bacterium]